MRQSGKPCRLWAPIQKRNRHACTEQYRTLAWGGRDQRTWPALRLSSISTINTKFDTSDTLFLTAQPMIPCCENKPSPCGNITQIMPPERSCSSLQLQLRLRPDEARASESRVLLSASTV